MKSAVVFFIMCMVFMHKGVAERLHKCRYHAHMIEVEKKLPSFILSAISYRESSEMPWVLGVQGASYRFKTKTEAIVKAKELIKSGVTNFDVGCMQVNYHFHKDQFANIEAMLDPRKNMIYAASVIHKHYSNTKSWKKAIAFYHSKDPKFGPEYARKVLDQWHKLLGLYPKKLPDDYFLDTSLPLVASLKPNQKQIHTFLQNKKSYCAYKAIHQK